MPWHTLSRGHVSTCTVCKPDGSSQLRPPQPKLTTTVWATQRERTTETLQLQPLLAKPNWVPDSECSSRFPPEILVHRNSEKMKWLWTSLTILAKMLCINGQLQLLLSTCMHTQKNLWNTISHFSIQVLTLLCTRDLMSSGMARVVCLWTIISHFYSLNLSGKPHERLNNIQYLVTGDVWIAQYYKISVILSKPDWNHWLWISLNFYLCS